MGPSMKENWVLNITALPVFDSLCVDALAFGLRLQHADYNHLKYDRSWFHISLGNDI